MNFFDQAREGKNFAQSVLPAGGRVHSAGNFTREGGLLHTLCGPSRQLWSSFTWCLVPVTESDFGCCGPLFGGEKALPKVGSTPLERLSRHRQPSRAWPIHNGESMPWQSAKN